MTTLRQLMLLPLALPLVFTLGCSAAVEDSARSEEVTQEVTQEVVGEFCEALFSCACIDHTFPDEPTCIATMEVSTHGILAEGHQAGLTFDEACFRDGFMGIDDQCRVEVVPDIGEPGTCHECSPFYGTVPVGEACTEHGSFDDCQQGSFCFEGVCFDPCVVGALDEPCSYRTGECEEGLICDSAADRCTKGPAEGEPCHSGGLCADGLLCSNDTDTCVVRPGVGMACPDLHCVGGVCVDGTCMPYGKVGEACFVSFDCEAGLFCDVPPTSATGGACAEPRASGEPCEAHEACISAECGPDGTCAGPASPECQ